jgi:hypothetical protein
MDFSGNKSCARLAGKAGGAVITLMSGSTEGLTAFAGACGGVGKLCSDHPVGKGAGRDIVLEFARSRLKQSEKHHGISSFLPNGHAGIPFPPPRRIDANLTMFANSSLKPDRFSPFPRHLSDPISQD